MAMMMSPSFRFFGSVVRRQLTTTTRSSRAGLTKLVIPKRHMSIFTQRTGPLTSRLVVDQSRVDDEREPLSPVKKAQLSLLLAGIGVAFGTILYSGATAKTDDATRALNEERVGYSTLMRERLFSTFGYFASSIGLTAVSALAFSRSEAVVRMALRSPMMFGIGCFIVTIGSMMGTMAVSPDKPLLKHASWLAFTTSQGAMMLPLAIVGGPIVAQAAAATGLMVGGISAVAAVAPSDSFLWMQGGLTVGLMCVAGASIGSMFFPASSLLQNVALYGGLSLFGGMQLYDVQKVTKIARDTPPNVQFDPMRHSVGMYLNTLNIFVRMVQVFSGQNSNRRR